MKPQALPEEVTESGMVSLTWPVYFVGSYGCDLLMVQSLVHFISASATTRTDRNTQRDTEGGKVILVKTNRGGHHIFIYLSRPGESGDTLHGIRAQDLL